MPPTRPFLAVAVAAGLALAAVSWADPPKVASVSPYGARRGEASEVTIFGTALEGKPRLIAPFAAEVVPISADAGSWKARITPKADVPVGVYVCRVRTDEGLSNPFLFAVGQFERVAEKEDNSSFAAAQPIPTPCVVEGEVAGSDVDHFRFVGKKGQRFVVDAQCARIGSGVDPTLRLSTASHGYVASAEDTPGLATDARLTAVLPEDGDYVVELSDTRYQGGARPIYRLLVGAVPVADEVFPLGGREGETVGLELRGGTLPAPTVAAATIAPSEPGQARPRLTNHALGIAGPGEPIVDLESMPPLAVDTIPEVREPLDPAAPPLRASAPVVINGRIESRGDVDTFVVAVVPGQKLRVAVDAAELGSALDGVLQVKGPDGAVLANADDTAAPGQAKGKAAANKKQARLNSPDPSAEVTVPGGVHELTVTLRDLRGEGGVGYPYRLTVEPASTAPFALATTDDQVNIPKGGTAAIGVEATRQGFDGPITLTVANPPPGLAIRPGLVRPGQTAGALTVTASADAPFDIVTIDVIGEAKNPSGTTVAHASKSIVFAQQANLPTNAVVQDGLPAATGSPLPIALESPATPIEVVPGFGAPVPIKVVRASEGDFADLAFGSLPLSPGLTVAGTLPAKANEGNATINATPETPLGTSIVALTAKGTIAGKGRTLAIPAVTVEVVRPAAVELATASAEIRAGETFELKGKVARKGPFNEPATIKLESLPAGLKAEDVVVPPGQADFVVKVVADPKAAAATATSQVKLAFQVAKKDYAVPTVPLAVKVIPAP